MQGHRYRLPLAIVLTALAAGAATLALRPREEPIEPVAVSEGAYFSPDQLERAREFRGPQRVIGLAGLGLSIGALALVALRPPRLVRRALDRASPRPLLGAAAVGAALSVGLALVGLPLSAVAHARAVDVGLSTQAWIPWLGDVALSAGIGVLFAAAGAMLGVALLRRFPRWWWAPGAVCVVLVSIVYIQLAPVVLDPLFNRYTPLPQGELRRDVLELAERSGVDVGEVYRVDASRRTTGANAYVGGLGTTKRVVLYDNLIERFEPGEVRSVVAHELAHVRFRDLPNGLLWLAIVAPAAAFLLQALTERIAAARSGAGTDLRRRRAGPAAVPALALAFSLVSFAVSSAGNPLSREVEARADAYALELTGDAEAFIGLERQLVISNVSEPDPPDVFHTLFGTHPKPIDRIGAGLAFERREDPAGG